MATPLPPAQIVAALPRDQRTLLITDGVFSMDGDLGALPALCDLADEFGCIMMVDDAHASGVFGRAGPRHRRSFRHARPRGRSGGHALEGDRRARRLRRRLARRSSSSSTTGRGRSCSRRRIRRRSRPPASRRSTCSSPSRSRSSGSGTTPASSRPGSQALGFDTGLSESPITPVIVGDGALAMKLSDRLFEEGVFAQGIGFPDRAARQGAGPDDRHRHPHRGRAAVRPRRFRRVGTELGHHLSRDRGADTVGSIDPRLANDRSAAAAIRRGSRFFKAYTQGPHHRRSRAPVHARRARGVPLLLAQHRLRRAEEAAVAPPHAARTLRLLFLAFTLQAHAGAARDLRRLAGRHASSASSSCFRAFTSCCCRIRRSRRARCGCSSASCCSTCSSCSRSPTGCR